MNKTITRTAILRALTDELIDKRQAEFVISSDTVDTYRTSFKLDGWDLDRYAKNPLVAYNHRTGSENPDMIIGTSEVFIENNELIGRVTFEDAELNPVAEKIRKKVKAGTLKMASIGANPLEMRMGDTSKGEDADVLYFTRTELLEWSIVPLGSNPDAHKRNKESISELRAEITNEAKIIQKATEKQIETKAIEKRRVFEAQLLINKNRVK